MKTKVTITECESKIVLIPENVFEEQLIENIEDYEIKTKVERDMALYVNQKTIQINLVKKTKKIFNNFTK